MAIKGVKGFNQDMTCRGFQYKEGETYETSRAKACEEGFHFCENPIDALNYYYPGQSVYHQVEGDGQIDRDTDDSKVACTKIKIGAKIDIPFICKATFDYVKSHCTNEYNAEPGKPVVAGDREAATAGNYGAATAGNYGAATAGESGAATAGESGAATAGYKGAATAGYKGAATAGYKGAATAGYKGAATAGNYGAATAGNYGAATAGDKGCATSRGKSAVGANGLAVVRGNGVMVKGGLGAILVIAEENQNDYDIAHWKAVVVDNTTIKADTWYVLNGDELVEVVEQ